MNKRERERERVWFRLKWSWFDDEGGGGGRRKEVIGEEMEMDRPTTVKGIRVRFVKALNVERENVEWRRISSSSPFFLSLLSLRFLLCSAACC